MEALTPWLTPALLVALFTWLRFDIREQRRELNGRIDALARDMTKRFDEIDGFLAGRRDRSVA